MTPTASPRRSPSSSVSAIILFHSFQSIASRPGSDSCSGIRWISSKGWHSFVATMMSAAIVVSGGMSMPRHRTLVLYVKSTPRSLARRWTAGYISTVNYVSGMLKICRANTHLEDSDPGGACIAKLVYWVEETPAQIPCRRTLPAGPRSYSENLLSTAFEPRKR